jgi:hypothetical protein
MRFLLLFVGHALAGCYGPYSHTTATTPWVVRPPPTQVVETPGPRPYPRAVWAGGYWAWRDNRYVWRPGRWVNPPRAGVVYFPPSWRTGQYGWYQTPGRWIPGTATDRYGRSVWFDSLGRAHYM